VKAGSVAGGSTPGELEWVCAADDWALAAAESAVSTQVPVATALVPAGDGGPGQATSVMPGAHHTAIAGFAPTQAGYMQEGDVGVAIGNLLFPLGRGEALGIAAMCQQSRGLPAASC
jgi:hypothetical protein